MWRWRWGARGFYHLVVGLGWAGLCGGQSRFRQSRKVNEWAWSGSARDGPNISVESYACSPFPERGSIDRIRALAIASLAIDCTHRLSIFPMSWGLRVRPALVWLLNSNISHPIARVPLPTITDHAGDPVSAPRQITRRDSMRDLGFAREVSACGVVVVSWLVGWLVMDSQAMCTGKRMLLRWRSRSLCL